MTVSEIFAELSAHMVKGLMFHEQMSDYYDFLNLKGYKRCHEYHFFCENIAFRKLTRYYINHYNKLIDMVDFDDPGVIPMSWWQYSRQEVTPETKRNAVKDAITSWVRWEKETKALYQRSYKNLVEIGEVAAAMKIKHFLEDVDEELKCAERKHLELMGVNYDLIFITEMQPCEHDLYKEKLKEMEIDL